MMVKEVGEVFKDVVGYEGLYQVSNLGSVKSLSREYIEKHNEFLMGLNEKTATFVICLENNAKKNELEITKI